MMDFMKCELNSKPQTFENRSQKDWFNEIKKKYKHARAQILPKESWQPLIDEWLNKHSNPDEWFILHIRRGANADIYRAALKRKDFIWRETENRFYDTPIYLETPLCGLDVDEEVLLETIREMKNKSGVLYYRNVPAPIVDKLYKDVFEERLAYPERFN